MAERTATVVLKAITTQYQKALKDAADATDRLITKAGGMEAIGGKMSAIGGTLTRSVTLPLALAGGAAVKMATDFETSFASLVGLAGVPQEEIEGLKQSVLDLAGETGRAPQELAEALYFAASAGLDAAGAMDAVKVAAKGAAAGLGGTTDIVGLVASAVASYGEESINAAEAVDVLTATIREGRADPDELAGTLGRILPIASQLGVSFDEVGGTVAYLSNVFGDTNRTVTATQGLLVKLLSPSKQGRKALEEMGTSVEELQAAISEDGLLGALDLLRERGFGENQQKLAELFDDIEGRQAALALLADKSGSLAETLGAVGDSAGAADSAFATMAETAGFKNAQAFAQLQTALIQVGDVLVPLAANVAGFAADLLEAFNNLPGPAQTAVIAFAGVIAATGPLMSISGKLATNWRTLGRGFDKVATSAFDASGHLGKFGAAVGALALTAVVFELSSMADELTTVNTEVERLNGLADNELAETLERMLARAFTGHAGNPAEAAADFADEIERIARESPAAAESLLRIAENADGGLADAMERAGVTTDGMREAMDRGIESAGRSAEANERNAEVIGEISGSTDAAAGGMDVMSDAADEATEAQEKLEDAIKAVTDAIRSQLDPLFATQDALDGHKEAQDDLKVANLEHLAATVDLDKAIKEHGKKSDEAAAAWLRQLDAKKKVEDADRKVVRSALDVAAASTELKMRVDEGTVSLEAAEDQLRLWVEQGLITADQAYKTAEELRGTASAADNLGGRNITIPVSADTSAFEQAMKDLYDGWGSVPGIRISVGGGGGLTLASGGPVPGAKGSPVPATIHGGEFVLSADVVDAIKNGRPTAGLGVASTAGIVQASTDNSRSVVVHNHYPAPERASDSITRTLRRAAMGAV